MGLEDQFLFLSITLHPLYGLILPNPVDKYIKKCEVEELSTTVMNMEFLDRFKNPDLQPLICRESGIIVGCSPDIKDGISIDDELRCSLLDQTSLNYDLF